MATVIRRPRSRYWIACFSLPDGARSQRSTRLLDRRKAQLVAEEWEMASRLAREGMLLPTKARQVLSDILRKAGEQSIDIESTRDYLKRWLRGKELKRASGTHVRYGNSVKLFLNSLGTRSDRPMDLITPKDVEHFRDVELRKGKAQSSVAVDLKTLRTAFNTAKRQGLIQINPVDVVDMPNDARRSREPFTVEQIRALLAVADEDWKTAILLGYYAGARLGDASNMVQANVTWNPAMLRYTQEKTGKAVECPIHPDLEKHLASVPIRTRDPQEPLCPKLAGRSTGGRNGLSRAFKDIMVKAHVADGRVDAAGGRGRAFSTWSFHSIRYSFNSHMANKGVEIELRQKLSGHAGPAQNERYTKREIGVLSAAVGKLPSVL